MAKKQTRRTISISKAYHAKLVEYCNQLGVPRAQLIEALIDLCVDTKLVIKAIPVAERIRVAQQQVRPKERRRTKADVELDEWWAKQKLKRAAQRAADSRVSERSSRV